VIAIISVIHFRRKIVNN